MRRLTLVFVVAIGGLPGYGQSWTTIQGKKIQDHQPASYLTGSELLPLAWRSSAGGPWLPRRTSTAEILLASLAARLSEAEIGRAVIAIVSAETSDASQYLVKGVTAAPMLVFETIEEAAGHVGAAQGAHAIVRETSTTYFYEPNGKAFPTGDERYVLETGDGGDSRWIARAGVYHVSMSIQQPLWLEGSLFGGRDADDLTANDGIINDATGHTHLSLLSSSQIIAGTGVELVTTSTTVIINVTGVPQPAALDLERGGPDYWHNDSNTHQVDFIDPVPGVALITVNGRVWDPEHTIFLTNEDRWSTGFILTRTAGRTALAPEAPKRVWWWYMSARDVSEESGSTSEKDNWYLTDDFSGKWWPVYADSLELKFAYETKVDQIELLNVHGRAWRLSEQGGHTVYTPSTEYSGYISGVTLYRDPSRTAIVYGPKWVEWRYRSPFYNPNAEIADGLNPLYGEPVLADLSGAGQYGGL